jgi:hypothetical protein
MNQQAAPRTIAVNHIQQKLFEAEYFYGTMREIQDTFIRLNNLLRAQGVEGRMLMKAFSYNLSALLSAHRSVRYYVVRVSGTTPCTTAWRKQIDDVPVLKAFHHLRDLDIHDETMNFGSTTKFVSGDPEPITTTEFALHRATLEASRRLKTHPDVIETLCSGSIVDISKTGIETLKAIVKDGFSKGYLTLQKLTY